MSENQVNQGTTKPKFTAKKLACCGAAIALGFLLSYVKVELPYGGAATAFSMFCICILGYFYGLKVGITSAAAYSLLQFIQNGTSYIISPFQVCCDYFFAFTALGLTGLFYKKKVGFLPAYFLAIFVRGLFHTLGGYLYWMEYMPESFPQSIAFLYPIVYNYSYILAEGIITAIVFKIPAVNKAFLRVKNMMCE